MSVVNTVPRVVPAALAAVALIGPPRLGAQSPQPWAGAGIAVEREGAATQVLVAEPAPAEARGRVAGRQASATPAVTTFKVRLENVSRGEVLRLADGGRAPMVVAPIVWTIHTGNANPLFTSGQPAPEGGLERLAEEGNPQPLTETLPGRPGVASAGADARPVGDSADGPLTPGKSYEFTVTAAPGQSLSLAAMFGQSNDLFYSNDRPIALFDAAGRPAGGDLTSRLSLWDAGTEVNQEPGSGPDQAPRQKAPDTGQAERKPVGHVRDRFTYPGVTDVLRLTVTPSASSVSRK